MIPNNIAVIVRLLAFRVFQLRSNVVQLFVHRLIITVLALLLLLLLLLFGGRRRCRWLICSCRLRHRVLYPVELSLERLHVTTQLAAQIFRLLAALLQLVRLQRIRLNTVFTVDYFRNA